MYADYLCTTVHIETIIFSKWYSRIFNLYIGNTVMFCLYVHTLLYAHMKAINIVTGKHSLLVQISGNPLNSMDF